MLGFAPDFPAENPRRCGVGICILQGPAGALYQQPGHGIHGSVVHRLKVVSHDHHFFKKLGRKECMHGLSFDVKRSFS